ncbi:hypothetical protein [Algoriphagus sp.]|jgi:hypothetical protein|uniref:hypothetical protein n=1 Tax=Algoriphagus sp. TaxID=1872435 RepID=UPI002716E547|nr:hypothetical protein [Algoriphagus sp.]MDO8966723.1 hypothetical protein [Algoriphagus sp.]MDP3199954.1 hypothetical protein [Algoriphagus sp.]
MQFMRVLGTVFLFLSLVGSLVFGADQPPSHWDQNSQGNDQISKSDFSVQHNFNGEVGVPLANCFIPERPAFRSLQKVGSAKVLFANLFGLSAKCQFLGRCYQKSAHTIETGLPAFLIAFPHHYFT